MLRINLAVGILAIGLVSSAHAGDVAAGKAKATVCASCHGENGISSLPQYPNLAGQKEQYLAKQLADFKAGKRTDPTMAGMVAPLSEADIQNLAAFYASLPAK